MVETNCGATRADKEVKALLTISGDSKIQEELNGAVRNKVGSSAEKKLKTKYREIKDNNYKTGRERKSYKFYREFDEILRA